LDHKANTIDKGCIQHNLEAASDYERGLERLNEGGKAIVNSVAKAWFSLVLACNLRNENGNQ